MQYTPTKNGLKKWFLLNNNRTFEDFVLCQKCFPVILRHFECLTWDSRNQFQRPEHPKGPQHPHVQHVGLHEFSH